MRTPPRISRPLHAPDAPIGALVCDAPILHFYLVTRFLRPRPRYYPPPPSSRVVTNPYPPSQPPAAARGVITLITRTEVRLLRPPLEIPSDVAVGTYFNVRSSLELLTPPPSPETTEGKCQLLEGRR